MPCTRGRSGTTGLTGHIESLFSYAAGVFRFMHGAMSHTSMPRLCGAERAAECWRQSSTNQPNEWPNAGPAAPCVVILWPYLPATHQQDTNARHAADEDDMALDMAPPADASPEAAMTDLYGDWQTEADVMAPVTDGVIPRNQYGNVEVPPHVPMLAPGLVHLNHPYITKTCKTLGVDYAAAMVGFERRRGGSVPVIQGVVVCEEHAPAVLEAYWEQQRCGKCTTAYCVYTVLRAGSVRSRRPPSGVRWATSCGRG